MKQNIRQFNIRLLVIAVIFVTSLSSCLKKDLPEFENFDLNEITNVYVEHRYESSVVYNGKPVVAYQRLTVAQTINKEAGTITLNISVPAANGTFTAAERDKLSQNHLWVYADISTAAKIAPIGDTPKLGDPADLSREQKYEVTAANGSKKSWTVLVSSFVK